LAECTLPAASIGYGRPEDVPMFHVAPGGSVMRVILPAGAKPPLVCPEWCGILKELTESAGSENPIEVDCSDLVSLAGRWRVDAIILEGIQPHRWAIAGFVQEARSAGFIVGIRSIGGALPPEELPVDFIVYDYVAFLAGPEEKVVETAVLASLAKRSIHVEVLAYIPEPLSEALTPLLHTLRETQVLHIILGDHKGGGPARKLYEDVRKVLPYTYLHASPYDYLDTYCPRCNALVAVREGSTLVSLKAEGGKCWRCGYPLRFIGPLYERTPDSVIRRSGVGTRWLDPRLLVRRSY
jgi:hypothetical protein